MSGHSKWSTIKRQKGANDAKRGQLFTKLANVITIAVREGGGVSDPNSNPRLRLAIDTARGANMPKDNIDRAIQRAISKQAGEMEEVTYEGFGPGGFSIIVEAITDKKQRTTPEVKSKFDKMGGSMGTPGSVAYQFQQKGLITISPNGSSIDDIFLIVADSGAEDLEEVGSEVLIYTRPEDLAKVRDALIQNNMEVKNAEIIRKPVTIVEITDIETAQKAISFTEKLEELDDVQKVYANYEIADDVLKSIL